MNDETVPILSELIALLWRLTLEQRRLLLAEMQRLGMLDDEQGNADDV